MLKADPFPQQRQNARLKPRYISQRRKNRAGPEEKGEQRRFEQKSEILIFHSVHAFVLLLAWPCEKIRLKFQIRQKTTLWFTLWRPFKARSLLRLPFSLALRWNVFSRTEAARKPKRAHVETENEWFERKLEHAFFHVFATLRECFVACVCVEQTEWRGIVVSAQETGCRSICQLDPDKNASERQHYCSLSFPLSLYSTFSGTKLN